MADLKITSLPVAGSVTLDDIIPIVDLAGPTSQRASLTVLRAALMPAVLTADVSGILPAANGGTGASSLPAGGLAGLTALAAGDAASVVTAGSNAATAITNERSAVRTLTNATIAGASNTLSVRIANDVTGLGAGVATWLAAASSANLLAAMTDKSGTGLCVFDTAPLFKATINLNNPANTFKYVITPAAIVADRILNLPLLTGTDTMVTAAFTQTLTNKTLTTPIMTTPRVQTRLDIDNTGNTFQYQITPAALAANRILNLPLMTGTDTFTLNAFAATLTNKTIDLTSNTLTFTSAQLKTACTDETGSGGALVFATAPTLTTPQIDGGRAELDSFRVKGEVVNNTTGNQDNIPRAAIIRCTADGLNIRGIDSTGAEHGEICELWFPIAFATGITILHQDTNSLAANRIISWTGATINALEQSVMVLRYDATTSRWRFVKDGF
jgi:hypothetical protein